MKAMEIFGVRLVLLGLGMVVFLLFVKNSS